MFELRMTSEGLYFRSAMIADWIADLADQYGDSNCIDFSERWQMQRYITFIFPIGIEDQFILHKYGSSQLIINGQPNISFIRTIGIREGVYLPIYRERDKEALIALITNECDRASSSALEMVDLELTKLCYSILETHPHLRKHVRPLLVADLEEESDTTFKSGIYLVGVELEGLWYERPKGDWVNDSSVQGLSGGCEKHRKNEYWRTHYKRENGKIVRFN